MRRSFARLAWTLLVVSPSWSVAQRSPAVSGTLSAIAPGLSLGQLYNAEPGRAALYTGTVAVGLLVYQYESVQESDCVGSQTPCTRAPRSSTSAAIGIFVALGGWVASIYDAPNGARRYNAKHGPDSRVSITPTLTRDANFGRPRAGLALILR
jgi:hypothetical protein